MKTIETHYVGPTDRRGARIIATDGDNRIAISYPYELSGEAVHRKAAEALCQKLDWARHGELIGGGTKRGYVFVFAHHELAEAREAAIREALAEIERCKGADCSIEQTAAVVEQLITRGPWRSGGQIKAAS